MKIRANQRGNKSPMKVAKMKFYIIIIKKESILITPYHDFNPKEYLNEDSLSVSIIKTQIGELLDRWVQVLKDTLDDPIVEKNLKLLDDNLSKLLTDFKAGRIDIDKSNVIKIRDAIMTLHTGLDKIELSMESLKNTFNKPMTPDEAIEAFKGYLNDAARGKDRNMIRIILK